MIDPFTWRDAERTVVFGRGTLARAPDLLGDGYVLLTTPRAARAAPDVVAGASTRHAVAAGRVDELAAALLEEVPDEDLIVALGGGRVIDTAKAIAAGRAGRPRVAAIPTTLSAAEMTRTHRLPAGAPAGTKPVRPAIVLNDPALSASQPAAELAASAANALAHAVEGAVTVDASVVPRLSAGEAARLTAIAYGVPTVEPAPGAARGAMALADADEAGRDALALAALLSGATIDAAGYGLHHVLSQTLVRLGGAAHGPANAAMLPHTIRALRDRAPEAMLPGVEALAQELARVAGAERLSELGVDRAALERCADAAAERADLDKTPPRADRAELVRLYEAAW